MPKLLDPLRRLFGRSAQPVEGAAPWVAQAISRNGGALVQQHAQSLRQAARSFEAAETQPYTASWSGVATNINELLARQLPTLRARSTNLARDDEWATRWLKQVDDNVLGEAGIRMMCRVRVPGGKEFDRDTNDTLEAFWQKWGKRGACEVSRRLSWRQVEGLLLQCWERKGEILLRHRPGAGPYGYMVQVLAPELLDVNVNRTYGGNRVRMGVEIDDDGAPLFYWLAASKSGEAANSDTTTVGKHVRVPASEIIHAFEASEVDQFRGIPGLAVGARRLWMLHDFEAAAAVATSNAAKRQGFFVSPDGNAPPGFADTLVSSVLEQARAEGKTLTTEELKALTDAAAKYATTVPGQFDTLPTGYDFKPFESKWPDVNADGYIEGQIRGFAAARGVSYHTLGNNLKAVNYSSAQVGILDERNHFRIKQAMLIDWVHSQVAERVITQAVLQERSLRPSRLPEYLAGIGWKPRTWAAIDPRKQEEADDIALRNKSKSRRQIWRERGLDPDDMQAEILEEEGIYGSLDAAQTPQATQARYSAPEPEPSPEPNASAQRLRAV